MNPRIEKIDEITINPNQVVKPQAAMSVTSHHVVISTNDRFAALFAAASKTMIGRAVRALLPADSKGPISSFDKLAEHRVAQVSEYEKKLSQRTAILYRAWGGVPSLTHK